MRVEITLHYVVCKNKSLLISYILKRVINSYFITLGYIHIFWTSGRFTILGGGGMVRKPPPPSHLWNDQIFEDRLKIIGSWSSDLNIDLLISSRYKIWMLLFRTHVFYTFTTTYFDSIYVFFSNMIRIAILIFDNIQQVETFTTGVLDNCINVT